MSASGKPDRASRASPRAPAGLGHSATIPSAGDEFEVVFPFVRSTYDACDEDGFHEVATWCPGVRFENMGPEDIGSVADALGTATFTVVGVFKPGRFPTRVFFTRQFTDPDGKSFGKGKLHIVTLDKFRRLTRGYQHPYGIGEPRRFHWDAKKAETEFIEELRRYALAQGIETRRAETEGLSPKGESAVGEADAPNPGASQ